jgi:glycolate oxidase FAD binding subunit
LLAEGEANAPVLVPTGSGTTLGRGLPLPRPFRFLDVSGLDAVLEYTPEDMTVRAGAGLPLARLQARLRERGQWLPAAGTTPAGTVGGLIAADRRGPLAGGWGSVRDYLIGIRFADGRGRDVRAGGNVVKNVAGYDLMKLLTGSLGTFGVVLEATFKVVPMPACFGAVRIEEPGPERCRRAGTETVVRWLPAAVWRMRRAGEPERLAALFAGPRERVAAQTAGVVSDWGGNGAESLDSHRAETLLRSLEGWQAGPDRDLLWGGALPTLLAEAPLGSLFPEGEAVADLMAGHVWARVPAGTALPGIPLNRDVAPAGGSAAWGSDPGPEAALWSRLKAALDPGRRLVHGRLPGGV